MVSEYTHMSDFLCPRNLTEVHLASLRLGCSRDKYGNDQYLCLPNTKKTALVELCHNGIMGMIVKGNCLETNEGKVVRKNCSEFKNGCPETAFNSKDIYKYRACHEINKEFNCYLAEPSCPSRTPNAELSTPVGIYSTTDIRNHTTTHQMVESDGFESLLWVMAPILIFVLAILLTIGYVWRRRNRTNMKQNARVEELKPLQDEEDADKPENFREIKEPNQHEDRTYSEDEYKTDRLDSNASEIFLKRFVGDYRDWKTTVSDTFSTIGCDRLYILFCFLCSESDSPDFSKSEWLEILNEVRRMAYTDLDPISSENAQETLKYLKRTESRLFEKDFQTITKDAADETIFRLSKYSRFLTFYMSNCVTSRQYLRLSNYVSEPGEKCIINKSAHFDSLLIHRLMMDILVHKSIEGTSMSKQISQILHIPENIITESIDKREEFLRNLQQNGEEIPNKVKTNGESQHVKWLWKFQRHEVVRSCIGLYPHSDIYIINHKAYRKHSEYHEFPPNVRCLLYSLLFAEKSKLSLNDGAYKKIMLKIRDNFLPTLPISDEELNLPEGIAKSQSGEITFASADIRHKVMYAFVTECLMDDVNLEFFLKEASKQVLFEYCRSWNYERKDGERCLYVPNKPVEMYDLFIERLDLDIIKHCTLSDWTIRNSVTEKLKVPLEILNWDQRARGRYVEYAKKGTQIVHQSRAMLVGCAGAGKTTLLKRLLKCSAEDIYNVETTLGLEVHEEIFEISDETLKETEIKPDRESRDFEGELNAERLSVFDFGGQSVYYACHQIYLTRRAFYIVVVDASQELHQRVSETVCKQDDGVFGGWTFGDYFVFWMKSIHTYCATENKEGEKPIVLIVATHWEEEKRKFKTKEDFLCCLQKQLPQGSSLAQYIEKKNCYCINFPIQPITELEKRIASIARQERWKENIPKEWAFFGLELKQKKYAKRVIKISEIKTVPVDANDEEKEKKTSGMKRDMLRFYHDTGKILYFNENHLKDNVILDVQWFIDAFKIIITDNLNLEGIPADKKDLDEFSLTGRLHDKLLLGIWEHRDQEICEELALDKSQSTSKAKDARFISFHKELLLLYMQRLGLVAVGEEYHYIPCMNRKDVEKEISELILASKNRTSILIFKFKFLPFFFFFRLVVACMQEENWKVLQIEEIPCLYKNAALFYAGNYNIVMSVTIDSIQLQVLCAVPGISLEIEKTYKILNTVEDKLAAITQTFHQRVQYEKGVRCKEDEEKTVSSEILGYFLSKIAPADMECKICPHHRVRDVHEIDIEELTKYWKLNLFKT